MLSILTKLVVIFVLGRHVVFAALSNHLARGVETWHVKVMAVTAVDILGLALNFELGGFGEFEF